MPSSSSPTWARCRFGARWNQCGCGQWLGKDKPEQDEKDVETMLWMGPDHLLLDHLLLLTFCLPYLLRSSNSSMVRGQSFFNNRDNALSANSLPPV